MNYKLLKYTLCAVLMALLSACSDEETFSGLSAEQRGLLGTAVNFDASQADAFTTRTTYNITGLFNENDIMAIYRQYYDDTKKDFDWQSEVFHVYYNKYKYATGTDISLGKDWMVAGNTSGFLARKKGVYSAGATATDRNLVVTQQTEADSLTWENGKTLRFRAWSRSNLAGSLSSGSKSVYYPDFEVADWVNVSGPTNAIPLALKHITSRIFFMYKNSGNRLYHIEISTNAEDYRRDDNADNNDNDALDKQYPKTFNYNGSPITLDNAEEAAQKVEEVYNRMCMPAGVNLDDGTLKSMTKTAYNNTTNFQHIEEWEYTDAGKQNLVSFNTKTPAKITSDVQRPVFTSSLDNRCYLLTIPYDMSNDVTKQGEILCLPPWTRFKVWLYDVNSGDKGSGGEKESNYHIFALDDMKQEDETTKEKTLVYPDGLQLKPGYSYEFRVGYKYDHMTITPGESFSWLDQDATIVADANDDTQAEPSADKYLWWKQAIKDAIPRGDENYQPEFHITNEEEYIEFVKLVNGTAGAFGAKPENKIYRLVKEYKTVTDANGKISKEPLVYGWSSVNDEAHPQWIEKEELEAQGYVFYEHYYPADGDKPAYSVEEYLQGPYSFYDTNLRRHFTVYLDRDLDFKDMEIDAVGTSENPFMGYFDGAPKQVVQLTETGEFTFTESTDPRIVYNSVDDDNVTVHTIKNLNVKGSYLFNNVMDAAIRNLFIESYHTIGLLNTASPSMNGDKVTGWGCYITGISVKANNTAACNAIAKSLTGRSFVVGCIHEGDASGALVGSASDLYMYGCMRTAANIAGGALMDAYPSGSTAYLGPQVSLSTQRTTKNYSTKPTWGRFMCNYYNKDVHDVSKDATAIGGVTDDYSLLEYIRGRASRILRAQNDNLLGKEVSLSSLNKQQQEEFYGLAPWKAMNYAIYIYNTDKSLPGTTHPCRVHFEVNTVGYDHTYPQMKSVAPDNYSSWNVLNQNN